MKRIDGWLLRFKQGSSIFTKTFLCLIILSLSMILFFGVWMNIVSIRNHRSQIGLSNLSRLRQAGESVDLTMEVLSQSMTQTIWSNDFITYMITPHNSSEDSEKRDRDYRMIRQLKSTVDGSDLIKKACFYSPLSGKIYQNTYTILDSTQFTDWFVLQNHFAEQTDSTWIREETRTTTTLRLEANRLFLIQDLNIATHIGTLVYELNLEGLYTALGLGQNTSEQGLLYVYDQNQNAVFYGRMAYTGSGIDWQDEGLFITEENAQERLENQTAGYYSYVSPKSGWTYLIELDTAGLSVDWRDIMPIYLPTLLIFLAISVGFAFYISHAVYQPINRLMKLATQENGKGRKRRYNEVAFLEGVFSNAIEGQGQLRGLIANIAPEVMDAMFRNLLIGKFLSEERVGEILEGVGNPIQVHSRFLVMVCRIEWNRERTITDTELNLYVLSVRNVVNTIREANRECQVYDVRLNREEVALVLGFKSDYPAVGMKREAMQIQQKLINTVSSLPFEILIESGKIYQNILDIRYACREAQEKLQYRRYLEEDEYVLSEEDNDRIVNQHYFRERTKAVVELATKGDKNGAENLVSRILEEMQSDVSDLAQMKQMAEMFLEEVTEKMIAFPLGMEDQKRLEDEQPMQKLEYVNGIEPLREMITDYTNRVIGAICLYNKKNCYKYVEQAKEYITENYADSNLSLNDVGEHIGISSSYLSEMFYEISGEKFSAYLATFRVEKAKQLLASTKVTIKEIGYLCGFNSIQNFIRVFKKYTDQTPGQYRESQT